MKDVNALYSTTGEKATAQRQDMKTIRFDTPFGYIEVLRNGIPILFDIEPGTYNEFPLDDGSYVHPAGCYYMQIDPFVFKKEDSIIVRYSSGELVDDGGDEKICNAIAEIEEYTIGFGFPDTHEYEDDWMWYKRKYPDKPEFGRERWLPFEYIGIVGSGIEYKMVDDPVEYIGKPYMANHLWFHVVWETNDKPYAWEIVSYLTA